MGYTAAPLERLIEEFSKFKGIGAKNATRMAYQVMSMTDEEAQKLAEAIQGAHTRIHRCRICQNYTEADVCPICSSAKRDDSVICVVEKPRDVQVFERTREYKAHQASGHQDHPSGPGPARGRKPGIRGRKHPLPGTFGPRRAVNWEQFTVFSKNPLENQRKHGILIQRTGMEKGGALHGTHQRASGDQNHRHQP